MQLSLAAWAHLILYGEEATKQAQKEGEEAAAAYEKEKRDIAAGILPAESPKPEKKKRKPGKKKKDEEDGENGEKGTPGPKKKRATKDDAGSEKKKQKGGDKESLVPILNKSVGKVGCLTFSLVAPEKIPNSFCIHSGCCIGPATPISWSGRY